MTSDKLRISIITIICHKQIVNVTLKIMPNENQSLCHRPNEYAAQRLSSIRCGKVGPHTHYEEKEIQRDLSKWLKLSDEKTDQNVIY